MRNYLLIFIIIGGLAFQVLNAQESVNLRDFSKGDQDSILRCAIVGRYLDYTRYLNNMLDRSVDPRVKVSSKTAIYNLTTNTQNEFQVYDEALEGKKNISYGRAALLEMLEKLAGENVVFEKSFLAYSCPQQVATARSQPIGIDGISYSTPVITYKMNFIEHTKISRQVYSNVRNESFIVYDLITKPKVLNIRLSKVIEPDIYKDFADSVKFYLAEVGSIKRLVNGKYLPNDSIRLEKIERSLTDMDKIYAYNFVEFLSIYEEDSEVAAKDISRMNKENSGCGCEGMGPPEDSDSDGYSVLVDCDDQDPSVYPGAPINLSNGHPDDNCDGEIDRNCSDNDGDNFEGGPDCDCDPKLDKKCDCNDAYADIYPGASINCFNNYADDNCDGIPDSLQLQRRNEIVLNALDHTYPPWGLTKFGKDAKFYMYTGLIAAGAVSSVYFKIQSDKHYTSYKASSKLAERDVLYDKANINHQKFLISLGSTAFVYICSHIDLTVRISKYKKDLNDIQQFRDDCVLRAAPLLEFIPLREAQGRYLETAICLRF